MNKGGEKQIGKGSFRKQNDQFDGKQGGKILIRVRESLDKENFYIDYIDPYPRADVFSFFFFGKNVSCVDSLGELQYPRRDR